MSLAASQASHNHLHDFCPRLHAVLLLPSLSLTIDGCQVLHNWRLETKKMLVRKAFAALPAGGVFLEINSIVDDERQSSLGGLELSLTQLVEFGHENAFVYTMQVLLPACATGLQRPLYFLRCIPAESSLHFEHFIHAWDSLCLALCFSDMGTNFLGARDSDSSCMLGWQHNTPSVLSLAALQEFCVLQTWLAADVMQLTSHLVAAYKPSCGCRTSTNGRGKLGFPALSCCP